MSPPVVAVIGTCDTKYEPLCYLKRTITATQFCTAILIDIGTYDPPSQLHIDITRSQVLSALSNDDDEPPPSGRDAVLSTMSRALTSTLVRLHSQRAIAGVINAGGSGNTSVCAAAFQALPVGFPKLLVSTMASGNVSHYIGESDVTMMYSVVDVAGMNALLDAILGNAAAAIAGMTLRFRSPSPSQPLDTTPLKPTVAISMFGVTTPCVRVATQHLESLGYAVITFHATGPGGLSMERLIHQGYFTGVLDLTTTESPQRTCLLVPLRGFSSISVDGGPFRDAQADGALLDVLRSAGLECPVQEMDVDINDPAFTAAAVTALHRMIPTSGAGNE